MGREFHRLDVIELLSSLSVLEFDRWFEHFSEQPFTFNLTQYWSGQMCAAIYNASTNFKNTVQPQEFYPGFKKPGQSAEDQAAIWGAIAE